jgi:predicted metalloprotease with PDZ domain
MGRAPAEITARLAFVLPICASLAAGCASAAAPARQPPRYTYAISPPASGSWMLQVEATLERAPTARLIVPVAEPSVRDVVLVDGGSRGLLARDGDAWLAPPCRSRCTIRYAVDLDTMASSCRGLDCVRRVGDAIIGPTSTWILRPDPAGDAIVQVAVRRGDPARFATGLRRDDQGGYVFRARELGESSYSAFGSLRRGRVQVTGAALDVTLLGAPLAMGDEATLSWLRDSASCVARLFGRFPVDASVFVLPVRGADEVVFGRVMSLAGASVALLFGTETRAETAHQDWVVVHELFHLGTPSFVGEGHWLEEGLATYYEPILRERAGWISERDLWRHFAREMPRGLRKPEQAASLEEREDIDSTYWGGALFALLADVRIRQATGGARSLDDAMRAALAQEGDATHSVRVADFLSVGDQATGGRVLADLYAHFALAGEAVDLGALWKSLGVGLSEGETTLRSDAALVPVRRGITSGGEH